MKLATCNKCFKTFKQCIYSNSWPFMFPRHSLSKKSFFFFFFLFKIKVIVLCFYGDFYGCPAMRKEWINKLCYTSWVNNILHTLSAIWLPLTWIPSLRMWQVHGTQLHQINKCILLTTWLENSIILQFSNRYRQS